MTSCGAELIGVRDAAASSPSAPFPLSGVGVSAGDLAFAAFFAAFLAAFFFAVPADFAAFARVAFFFAGASSSDVTSSADLALGPDPAPVSSDCVSSVDVAAAFLRVRRFGLASVSASSAGLASVLLASLASGVSALSSAATASPFLRPRDLPLDLLRVRVPDPPSASSDGVPASVAELSAATGSSSFAGASAASSADAASTALSPASPPRRRRRRPPRRPRLRRFG